MHDSLPDHACSILTHAAVEVRLSEIAGLRDAPGPATAPSLPKRFLRHCDEQTVVGMMAVLHAIDRLPSPRPSFDRWGVLSASCQAGRLLAASALIATRTAGARGVSPHVVPQCSLHSPASAVSVALAMHGPHFGIGGGPESFDEAMFSACSMLAGSGRVGAPDPSEGAWLILTAWETEPALDEAGASRSDPTCCGIALALQPGDVAGTESTIAVLPGGDAATDIRSVVSPAGRIRSLAAAMSGDDTHPFATLPLRHGFTLHMQRRAAAARLLPREAA